MSGIASAEYIIAQYLWMSFLAGLKFTSPIVVVAKVLEHSLILEFKLTELV